jgi:plasmid stabilization system protein ParE
MLAETDLAILAALDELQEQFPAQWAFTANQIARACAIPRWDVLARVLQLLCDAYLMGDEVAAERPLYRLSARGQAYLARGRASNAIPTTVIAAGAR